ncbi:ABC transporter substrate-binding protein [Chloroflexota bacterium]
MKKKLGRVVILSLVVVAVLSIFAACTAPADEAAPSTIEVTDQLGRTVKLDRTPQRIISLAPSNTEILFALGLADRLVAVTDYCNYPPEAEDKPKTGGFSTPNIEEVIALSPDLILATSIHEKRTIPQLEGKGLTVFALNPRNVDEVLESITLVGEVTGKREQASGLVAEMRNRIKTVTDKSDNLSGTERPRVLYAVWHDPLTAPGSTTLQDDLIEKAGGINITRDLTGYAAITLEAVIATNPEVMIAGGGHGAGESLNLQFIKTEPRLRNTDARRNNRVYGLDGDLVSRPGPRIVEGLEKFAEFIHPELFSEK